jgi:hypothetical protein
VLEVVVAAVEPREQSSYVKTREPREQPGFSTANRGRPGAGPRNLPSFVPAWGKTFTERI